MQIINVSTVLGPFENREEILAKEMKKIYELQAKGVVEHIFIKDGGTGAFVAFKNLTLDEVKVALSELPLFPYFKQIDYQIADKIF